MSDTAKRATTGLRGLREERGSFAVLGLVLLVAQMLLGGLSQGAMAAERLERVDLSIICHTLDGENRLGSRHPGEPERDCPCLAGACLVHATLRAEEAPTVAVRSDAVERPAPVAVVAPEPERRPLALFARAGRGPPSLA